MKILCIGRNYVAHAQELGNDIPTEPVVFLKPSTALANQVATITYPSFSNDFHYEIEVILRIGKKGKLINKANAIEHIDALTLGIDFTARDKQDELKKKGLPWEKAKAFDESAFVTNFKSFNEIDIIKPIYFSLYKNNDLVQQGDTSLMMYNFATIIEELSKYMTLEAGDLIFTGTPAGVGSCQVGDVLKGKWFDEEMFEVKIV